MASADRDATFSEETIESWYSSEWEDTVLLENALSCKNDMVILLANDKSSTRSISLLVHVLGRAVGCKSLRDRPKVYELLNLILDSPLLNIKGVELLTECESKCSHAYSCVLNDFVLFLQCAYAYMPTSLSTPQIIGFVDLLKEKINETSDIENKDIIMGRIFELKNSIISNISDLAKIQKSRRYNNGEDNMKPPINFREMSVMPTEADLLYETSFLRRNKAHGKYNDLDHYLDVQFRLYREDCIIPLRDVYEEFIEKQQHNNYFRLESGRIYRNIKILKGTSTSLEHGEVFVVELDQAHCKRIKWGNSKRLIFGSLLLLSFDNFTSTLFAVVSDADREVLREVGQFKVQIFKIRSDQSIPRETNGVILEATSAYFEAYYHVLNAIQAIQETLPFQRYIVHCETEIDVPKFLLKTPGCKFDILPVLANSEIKLNNDDAPNHDDDDDDDDDATSNALSDEPFAVSVDVDIRISRSDVKLLNIDKWPSKEVLHLDESQRQAFITSLTKEFVLIQGPPGTGKTHLGLQITKALLHNKNKWKKISEDENQTTLGKTISKPCILVVCYTNHALDQFIEGIINFLPRHHSSEIVRIGSQCKNSKVEKCSIKELRKYYSRNQKAVQVLENAEGCKKHVLTLRTLLKTIQTKVIVLHFEQLQGFMQPRQRHYFANASKDDWFDWLHASPRSWFKEVQKRIHCKQKKKRSRDTKKTRNDQECIDVEEADYAHTERSLDDDIELSLDITLFGLDVEEQLSNILQQPIDEKYKTIIQEEVDNIVYELKYGIAASELLLNNSRNVWEIPLTERWKMYRYWLRCYLENVKDNLGKAEEEFNSIFKIYRQARVEIDEDIMRKASVIAMTTTGAAKYHESLQKVCPQITIIEEAAEVPEAHIVTAINPQCEHIILIGDHKQLEPKPAVMKLATKYNLSVSLFERMLNNGLHYHCLERQHRMRPEISNLVRHIYPVLEDNENVYHYEDIKGIRQNLFFIDHDHNEQYNEDGKSYSNEFEANFIAKLCEYLLKQGYKGTEITILAAYTGQMFCIREKMPRSKFGGVNISVLDNYQGEENEIILLSLVRNNEKGDIGFLSKENRICVALSRAKKGLYILGNSSTLTYKSKHWQNIINKIQEKRETTSDDSEEKFASFGKSLPLFCQNHSEEEGILASSPDDFSRAPDGGCSRPCEVRLDCGHACQYRCHPFDRDHNEYTCEKLCRKRCKEDHICEQKCHFPSECNCLIKMNRLLECNHNAVLDCYLDTKEHLCQTNVNRTLKCGHDVLLKCHVDSKSFVCKEKINGIRENCQHDFVRECHDLDFEANNNCIVKVEKTFSQCGHAKSVKCFIDLKRINCKEIVEKVLKCGHNKTLLCYEHKAGNFRCNEKCGKTCEHGHICERQCHFPSECACKEIVDKVVPKCGHSNFMPCSQDVDTFSDCNMPVEIVRQICGHPTTVVCKLKTKIEGANLLKRNILEEGVKCEHLIDYKIPKCHHFTEIPCWEWNRKNGLKTVLYTGYETFNEIKCDINCLESNLGIKCNTIVTADLDCGHVTEIECWQKDQLYDLDLKCKENVEVKLERCGHSFTTECYNKSFIVHTAVCEEEITYIYPECHHKVRIKCNQIQTRTNSQKPKRASKESNKIPPCSAFTEVKLECGHVKNIICHMRKILFVCEEDCHKLLFCGHRCSDLCINCTIRGTHKSCDSFCNNELFCGHTCENSECLKCTFCNKQCEFLCEHSACTLLCKETCMPCEESCSWICPHFECKKSCAEDCDRPLCSEDCKVLLSCGHSCPGFCGEPCPLACQSCDSEKYEERQEAPSNGKFITLRECGHSFNCEFLDEFISKHIDQLVVKCPVCKTIVHRHPRYNSVLKRKKRYLEEIKNQLQNIKGRPVHFPVMDQRIIKQFMAYVEKFFSYLQIIRFIEIDPESQSEIYSLEKKGKHLMNCLKNIPRENFQNWMDVSNAMFSLHVDWILRLCLQNKKLMDKEFIVHNENLTDVLKTRLDNKNSNSQQDAAFVLKTDTSNIDMESILIANVPQSDTEIQDVDTKILEDSYSLKENTQTDVNETPEIQPKIQNKRSETRVTGHQIVEMVRDASNDGNCEKVNVLIELLTQDIKDEPHVTDAIEYPKLTVAMGIHSSDWTVCNAGHATPGIISDACLTCSNVGEIQWVADSNDFPFTDFNSTHKRRQGRDKSGFHIPSDQEKTQNQNDKRMNFVTSSFVPTERKTPVLSGRGFINSRSKETQQRQNRRDFHLDYRRRPYQDHSAQTAMEPTPYQQYGSEPDREMGGSRHRDRGNWQQRWRGGRRGAANTRSELADSIRESMFQFGQRRPNRENASDRERNQRSNFRFPNRARGARGGRCPW